MRKFFHLKAFLCHAIFSLFICISLTILIITLWYPSPWYQALGGMDLLFKILAIDICIGPICVGLVYKTYKKLLEKISDVSIITLAQLCFLGYGFYVVSLSRPVFIIFIKDRFEVMIQSDIEQEFLDKASSPYNKLSLTGPVYTSTKDVTDEKVKSDMAFNAMQGLDYTYFPEYYQDIMISSKDIAEKLNNFSQIKFKTDLEREIFEKSLQEHGIQKEKVLWLPVKHRFGFMTAIMAKDNPVPLFYINIDPYGE